MKIRFVIVFIIVASISACVKDPAYPIEPRIEFKSVATSSSIIYLNGTETIYVPDTITISFTDGDGDISTYDNPADSLLCVDPCVYADGDSSCLRIASKNIFVVDSRDTCIATYSTANIESTGKFKGISGEILILHKIFLKQCFLPDISCAKETVQFKIRIRDNAGNFSNEVETTPITVEVRNL